MPSSSELSPLHGVRVVELTGSLGQLCGRALADLGAEVIKIEPSGGCVERSFGPFLKDALAPENSLYFWYFNSAKKSVTVDLSTEGGRSQLRDLLGTADVFIESLPPGTLTAWDLDFTSIAPLNPHLVMASITGFGQSGPYRNYKSPDPVTWALGGQLWLTGKPDREPSLPPIELANSMASLLTAFGILAALRARAITGLGEHIDSSVYEAIAGPMHQLTNYGLEGQVLVRRGSRHPAVGGVPYGAFPTQDHRFAYIFVLDSARRWREFVEWIGSPVSLLGAAWENRQHRLANAELVEAETERFTLQQTLENLCREGAERGIGIVPIATPAEYLADEQTQIRGHLVNANHPQLGAIRFPRSPLLSNFDAHDLNSAAPTLGQHTDEVLGSLKHRLPDSTCHSGQHKAISQPLAGLRILDFTHAAVGPVAMEWFAQFGAEVLKVESNFQTLTRRPHPDMTPDVWRRAQATFAEYNLAKQSLHLNMQTPEAQDIVRRMIPTLDVIAGNFTPGVFEKWGLDYQTLEQLNPRIILANISGFGQSGPRRNQTSVAPTAMAVSGIYDLWHYRDDEEPVAPPVWAGDYVASGYLASAILAAIHQREKTGRGQWIDLSQAEANGSLLGHHYLDVLLNGVTPHGQRMSAYDIYPWEPNDVFPCRDGDQWCVITVASDEEWQALCQTIGYPEVGMAEGFASLAGRRVHRAEIRTLIESWTRQQSAYRVMHILQRAGVPAGLVQSAEDLYRCPHLRERGFVHHPALPGMGPVEMPGRRLLLHNQRVDAGDFPELNGASAGVLRDILGLSADEIADLTAKSVFV